MPSHKIPQGKRTIDRETYNYMHIKNDEIDIEQADLKRRNSTPAITIGVS